MVFSNDLSKFDVTTRSAENFLCATLGLGDAPFAPFFSQFHCGRPFSGFAEFPGFNQLKKRFIGHLQTNKVNKCLRLFDTIDSVDSLKLAKKINSSSTEKKTECLIEINTSKEPQKHGFNPIISEDLISCFTLKNLEIVGLMTIGPYTSEEKKTRNAFKLLRKLKEDINSELGEHKIKELSMGMSGDFEIGVQEGSTMVRVGTGIFGARNY